MKSIIITGATRGIGYGLAAEFLKRGHRVAVSGRTADSAGQAVSSLSDLFPGSDLLGRACDVRSYPEVVSLWEAAAGRWGRVDIWINNAGIAHPVQPAWELAAETAREVVETNLLGTYNGCKAAIPRMLAQGGGAIYNMEGYGSTGGTRMGLALYGTSKAGTHFLSKSLTDELKNTPVILGTLQPGMVATELVSGQYEGREAEWEQVRKILNIFVETVGEVAPKLVDRILRNTRNGITISASSRGKILLRFAAAPFRKREVFEQ